MTENIMVPTHLGLILDGNRRWARSQGLPTLEGHRKGYDNLKTIARHAFESGVQYVSAFVFSTENWNRAKQEVDYLMNLAMKIASKDAAELIKENIKIVVLGIEDRLDAKLVDMWRRTEEDSKNNTGGTLALCFNYGGLREISDAVKKIAAKGAKAEDISEELVAQNLYHPEVPAVDLMIRTSGEQRISNFMLWRLAYAELYFTNKHWPAFTPADLDLAIAEYTKRQRRYGK
jgi:undecaprenyl diphosphate synthase